jgi:predicted DNA-binding protein
MTPESMQQLKEIHNRTGKSKSRIVRDAIKKEYKEIRR